MHYPHPRVRDSALPSCEDPLRAPSPRRPPSHPLGGDPGPRIWDLSTIHIESNMTTISEQQQELQRIAAPLRRLTLAEALAARAKPEPTWRELAMMPGPHQSMKAKGRWGDWKRPVPTRSELYAMAKAAGLDVKWSGRAADDWDSLARKLKQAGITV